MKVSKEIKLFEINFSDSDEEDLSHQSLKDQSLNINLLIGSNIKQAHQLIQQTNNNPPSKDDTNDNLQRKDQQNQNNSIFEIDFNTSSLETPIPKHHSSLRKIKRSSKNIQNKIFFTKNPFMIQSNKNNHNKNQQIQQKRKKFINQKNKIQKFNQSFGFEDLEEIKLEAVLKRSDTSTTDQSLKETICMKQPILLDQSCSNNQNKNQNQLFSKDQAHNENSQNNQAIEQQVQNHLPLFRQFRSFSFDSQLTQGSQIQQRYEGHSNEQQQHNEPFNLSEIQRQNSLKNEDKKDQLFDVLSDIFSSEQYLQKRKAFLQIILNPLKTDSGIKQFLTTQISKSQMFEFQVHVYKDLFKTQYQLWIKPDKTNDDSVLIANAYNDSFHINKSSFIINRVNQKNQKKSIGRLESNFARDFYSLHGYHSKNYIKDSRNIHCYEFEQIMNMSFTVDRVAYLSKSTIDEQIQNVKKSQVKVNQKQKSHQNLKQKYQVEKFTHQKKTFKLIPQKNIEFDKGFYNMFGIRDSKKTLLMQDGQNHNNLLFIGKIASKKYKLLVGQGLSPLQAFGMVISHVEVN